MSNTLLVRIWTFYRDGFREMTLDFFDTTKYNSKFFTGYFL